MTSKYNGPIDIEIKESTEFNESVLPDKYWDIPFSDVIVKDNKNEETLDMDYLKRDVTCWDINMDKLAEHVKNYENLIKKIAGKTVRELIASDDINVVCRNAVFASLGGEVWIDDGLVDVSAVVAAEGNPLGAPSNKYSVFSIFGCSDSNNDFFNELTLGGKTGKEFLQDMKDKYGEREGNNKLLRMSLNTRWRYWQLKHLLEAGAPV